MGIGAIVNAVVPEKAFEDITSVSTGGAILIWGVIVVSHLVCRRRVRAGEIEGSMYRMPGAPYTNWLVLGCHGDDRV